MRNRTAGKTTPFRTENAGIGDSAYSHTQSIGDGVTNYPSYRVPIENRTGGTDAPTGARDMVHFDARLDTWAHARSPGCGSRVVLYVSILQLAHELLWLRIALFRHGSREAFDGWLTWA